MLTYFRKDSKTLGNIPTNFAASLRLISTYLSDAYNQLNFSQNSTRD